MVWIIAQRGNGNFTCPPIIDAYISTDAVAIERGRNELDSKSSNAQEVTMSTIFRLGVRMGDTISVMDELQGEQWLGKIVGIEHSVIGGTIGTQLDVERQVSG